MKKGNENKKKITVKTESQRLDVFLAENLKITRSQAQKLIDNGQIEINGQKAKKTGEKIKVGDEIFCQAPSEKSDKNTPKTKQEKEDESKKNELTKKIEIITETPDYLIVNKPSGLLTHPTTFKETVTLSGWLAKKYPELKKVGDDPMRPGIVHRLDKEASGLLVVPRTQKMFECLKKQFQNRTIEKEYLVLVHGQIEREEGTIDFPIIRSDSGEKMAAIPKTNKGLLTDKGKDALTEFWVKQKFINFTFLEVKIHTGRTHQIRAHMFAYNHPVVGDPLYYTKKQKRTWDKECGRLFLHSARLAFKDLENNKVEFESPLPAELKNFLKKLK